MIAQMMTDIYQRPIPGVTIGGRTILLFAPFGAEAWSVINLLLGCIVGLLFAVLIALYALRRKRQERKKAPDVFDVYEAKQKNLVWLTVAIGMGIAGAFLFALIQDMSRLMVILDMWTVTHSVIIATQIIAVRIILKRDKEGKDRTERGFAL